MLWYQHFPLSGFCYACQLFLPLVSIFGLFPVLVSCHYELSMFQLCLSRYVLIIPCILVLSFEFGFVWSTRHFPVYPVSLSCLVLPCSALLSIKYYYLSLSPRLRVPVSSLVCAPWHQQAFWALLSGFLNTSDCPLCSHAICLYNRYACDWLQWSSLHTLHWTLTFFESCIYHRIHQWIPNTGASQ